MVSDVAQEECVRYHIENSSNNWHIVAGTLASIRSRRNLDAVNQPLGGVRPLRLGMSSIVPTSPHCLRVEVLHPWETGSSRKILELSDAGFTSLLSAYDRES